MADRITETLILAAAMLALGLAALWDAGLLGEWYRKWRTARARRRRN